MEINKNAIIVCIFHQKRHTQKNELKILLKKLIKF